MGDECLPYTTLSELTTSEVPSNLDRQVESQNLDPQGIISIWWAILLHKWRRSATAVSPLSEY